MSSLRPVSGTPREVLALLREWDAAAHEPEPLVIATSGSTGEPKRVVLSRRAMRASAHATHDRLGGPGQWLLNLPAGYVAGVQVLFRSVLAGTDPVVQDEHEGFAAATDALSAQRRYVSLVPTQLVRLLADEQDVAALRTFDAVLVGGAALVPATRRIAEERGVAVVATYGMSETCGGCVYDGVPLDGVAVSVASDGRIRIGGAVLFEGYDEAPGLTAQVTQDGWFLTHDVGRLDEDGRLQVLGRTDDVVVSGGVNVPATAVAERLTEHDAVLAAEVVGLPDEEWGRRVVAVVVRDRDRPLPPIRTLRDFVAERHPRAWAPRDVVEVQSIPLLDNGKVDRRALERLAEQALPEPAPTDGQGR